MLAIRATLPKEGLPQDGPCLGRALFRILRTRKRCRESASCTAGYADSDTSASHRITAHDRGVENLKRLGNHLFLAMYTIAAA